MTEALNLFGMVLAVQAIVLTLVSLDWLATDGLRLFRQWRAK